MQIQPYLFFDGRCEQAIAFYRQALGAEVVMLMRFGDSPEPARAPDGSELPADKIMHACLQIGETQWLLSDGLCSGRSELSGFSLSLTVAEEDEVDRRIDALAAEGSVRMAPAATFFARRFGMAVDHFGVSWMVLAPRPA